METVKINIYKDQLIFSYDNLSKNLNNFINSNNIYRNELVYSLPYINKNLKKVSLVLRDRLKLFYSIKIVFSNEVLFVTLIELFRDFEVPIDIEIKGNLALTYDSYKKLIKFKNLNSLKCYFMPENYVHSFALKNISVYFTFDSNFSSGFVKKNNLLNMKEIYYKRNIIMESDFLNDFQLFLTLNRHLKIIHIYDYSFNLVDSIISIVENDGFLILIHQNNDNLESLSLDLKKLKKLNKKYKKVNGEIRIVYSDDFITNNLFRQLTYSNIKVCSGIIIYLAFVLLISNYYNDYVTWFNSNAIQNSLSTNETTSEIYIDDEMDEPILSDDEEEDSNPYSNIPTSLETLVSLNSDTVGWLSINNTKVNYPVTQSGDNDYYLNRDFYERRTANGWIFMDYRNDAVNLSKNTIIYGHALLSGYMFGDLRTMIKSSWYKNKNNLLITFNTLGKEMKWEIFSIYRTPYTTDYLKVNFFDDDEFLSFVDLIADRSVYNFGVKIDENDYILTLSTCSGNDNGRLVVHAKLVQ